MAGCSSGSYIGKSFDLYGEYSEAEVSVMRSLLRSGDTVIDIGANIGDLTLPLAQMVGPEGQVIALESHADIFNVLCGNMALNQITHVRPINAFVKNNPGAVVGTQFVRSGVVPPSIKIDDLGLKTCGLIKIDVDGNELDVLQSGAATIDALRPFLYFENDKREKSKDLLAYLLGKHYLLYWHVAPIFSPDNYFGNKVNAWAPNGKWSLMVLGVPQETGVTVTNLAQINKADEWVVDRLDAIPELAFMLSK